MGEVNRQLDEGDVLPLLGRDGHFCDVVRRFFQKEDLEKLLGTVDRFYDDDMTVYGTIKAIVAFGGPVDVSQVGMLLEVLRECELERSPECLYLSGVAFRADDFSLALDALEVYQGKITNELVEAYSQIIDAIFEAGNLELLERTEKLVEDKFSASRFHGCNLLALVHASKVGLQS
ncbi:MAG: hypothetical protein ABII07_04160 [Patescibacteria group bacterium]